MSLQHCVIHHMERAVPGAPISTRIRESENSAQGPALSLFEQLKLTFQRSAQKQYGTFDRELSDNPVPGWIREQHSDKLAFLSMAQRLMQHLQSQMEHHDEAFSAHILIAVDNVMGQDQWYLFWIHSVDAACIDIDLEVATTHYIDSGRLAYGARLFVDEWLQEDTPKYLSIITTRGNKVLSDAFARFIGFSTGLDLVEDTREFLQIVDDYVETLPEEKTADIKGKIVDYCVEQDKTGAPIVFDDLSGEIDQSAPDRFAQFVNHHQRQPRTEIYADRGSLKRYTRFFGRDNTMSISFSSDLFGDAVVWDESSDTLTIHRIPKSLKQQLKNGPASVKSE